MDKFDDPSPKEVEKNPQGSVTVVQAIRKFPPLECRHSQKILKHEIISPKLYELLIKAELKGNTAIYLNNLYNHINMFLNTVTRLREDILPVYQKIKRNFEFHEQFLTYFSYPYYYWNEQTWIYLGCYILVVLTNDTCIKSSM